MSIRTLSETRPTADETVTAAVAPTRRLTRAAGWGGLGFATLVLAENALRSSTPQSGATIADVMSYYRDNRVADAIGVSGYVLTIPCLLLFAEGLRRLYRDNPVARAGVGGLHAMMATFGLVVCFDVALITLISSGSADPATVTVLWTLHNTAFTLNVAILGGTFLLLSSGAGRGNLLPRWLRPLGVAGGASMIVGSVALVPAVEGSPIGLAGLAGFIAWLVWVIAASVALIRR